MRLPSLLPLLPLLLLAAGCGERPANGAPSEGAEAAPELRLRVRTAPVVAGRLDTPDRIAGTARAFVESTVKAEAAGRVIERVVERGDLVEQGDVLVQLDASRLELEFAHARASLRARYTDLRHAQSEWERGERLVEQDAISEQRRDDLRHGLDAARNAHALARVARDTAARLLEDASIRAPITGRVDDLFVELGDFVSTGTPVARVIDLSRVRIFGGVTADEAARLEPGQRAIARFASLGGLEQQAELRSVARAADPSDGTYRLELWVDEPHPQLRDGLVAQLEFAAREGRAQPLLPRAALVRRDGRSEVFVVERAPGSAEGVARVREVRTGRSGGDRVEVVAGLRSGEEVVVDGQFALRDGVAVWVEGARRGPSPEPELAADAAAAPAVD